MQQKPIIFLPIESTPREIDYKLNIARLMCHQGFDAIIGNPPFIRDELKYKNYQGVFLEKGMNPDPAYYKKIIDKGILVYCLSDEGAAEPAFSVTYQPAVDTLKQAEKIFLWGVHQKQDLVRRNSDPCLLDKYYVSGYPSFEFSLPKYKKYHAYFRDQDLGNNYILVNTNFSSVNGYSLEEVLKACNAMSPETKASITISYQHEEAVLKSFLHWLEEIFLAFPGENFLIRPHPAERQNAYDRLSQKYKNVRVSGKGNANQAISGAKLVLHNDCTTALQSYLACVPVISLSTQNEHLLSSPWSIQFGAKPTELCEAIALVENVLKNGHFDESLRKHIDENAQVVLSQRFCHIETSTKDIVDHIVKGKNEKLVGIFPYKIKDTRTLLKKVKLMIRKRLPLHYKVPVASRHMLAKFTKKDVLDRLNLMNDLDHVSRNYIIKEVFPNTFYIARGF